MAARVLVISGPSKPSVQAPHIKRLYQDLKQLKEDPIVGANAEPLEDDILTWYGLLVGVEGTRYAGIPIRFCLEFTKEYPNKPPRAYFETFISYKYQGGMSYKDRRTGRIIVCLNIFGNTGNYPLPYEGWSPSYSVHTILISMQALFLSSMLSKWESSIAETRKSAAEFRCLKTGHDGSDPSTWFPKVIMDYNIVAQISARSGHGGGYNALRDFYICYVKKTTASDPGTMLGYGIQLEDNATFSSPCEYVSKTAYAEGTRRGATNSPFEFWIPILINTPYRGKFMSELNTALDSIIKTCPSYRSRLLEPFLRDTAPYARLFKLCSSVMNNLVVEIMKNAGDMTANDKFINGYIAFYRLLISYAEVDSRMVQHANRAIRNFLAAPQNRLKSAVPNLGELLIHLTIADQYDWSDLAGAFMEECDLRNVKWYYTRPNFDVWLRDESVFSGRSKRVFELTKVSRTLVMYQVKFSRIVKTLTRQMLDSNYGLAPDEVRSELKHIFYKVQAIDSWDDFHDWVGMPHVAEHVRDAQLVTALKKSQQLRGYNWNHQYRRNYNFRNRNRNYTNGTSGRGPTAQPPVNLIDLISKKLT